MNPNEEACTKRHVLQKVIRAVAIVNPPSPMCVLRDYICLFASGTTDGGSLAVMQRGRVCVGIPEV